MSGHHQADAEPVIHTIETRDFIVRYPDLLEVQRVGHAEDVQLVLAWHSTDLLFRPTVVFTATPSSASLPDAAIAAIEAAGRQHPGARPLSVDVFAGADAAVGDPPVGRVLTLTYPAMPTLDVMVKTWVIATGTRHLHVSASFLPSQALAVERACDGVAAGLRVAAPREALIAAADGTVAPTVPLDDDASTRAGYPLEDLSAVRVPPPAAVRAVPIAAIDAMTKARGIHLDDPRALHVVVVRGAERGFYAAYPCADELLVLRTAGSRALDLDPAKVHGYGLSPERLPADAAAWIGIRPAHRFDLALRVTSEEFAGRVDGTHGGPPWAEFHIDFAGRWWRAAFVPGWGFFEVTSPEDGTVELTPLPSARFFDLILRRVDSTLGDAGGSA